ncbi:MAG TPA: hydroxysqualene dehydroxylase HpnE [Terriglobales bacterium]|nr:hydroxysqualene dehydroxylase HpnE [Terriglobales bacterium]
MNDPQSQRAVAVVGGGLAGLSAGCALADAGFKVTLFERRPYLGGRASSYEHPGTGEVVDNCQHVLLGCCTNLLDLYRRFGAEDKIRWFDRLTFIEPGGRRSELGASALPAPLHSAPSFLTASYLSLGDKLAIGRAMLAFMAGIPADTKEDFLSWLKRHGQTERAIERFWKVVLVSALNENLHKTSVYYAAQVFRESFLKSARAGKMGVPTVPLSDLYRIGGDYIHSRGGEVRLRASVDSVSPSSNGVAVTNGGQASTFDYAILAVPYTTLAKLLPQDATATALAKQAAKFESSPITGIHLWFDRQITDLDHAVLLDRTIQWMFHKSRLLAVGERAFRSASGEEKNWASAPGGGSYIELVVSASNSLVEASRQEVIELALKELTEFFPQVAEARLVKAAVIKEIHATYSAQPLSDQYRPASTTGWPNIFLAGDWTATGWPATMEGAVRSGYKAAEALTDSLGRPDTFLVPDLKPRGLMRLFD